MTKKEIVEAREKILATKKYVKCIRKLNPNDSFIEGACNNIDNRLLSLEHDYNMHEQIRKINYPYKE